MSEFIASVAAPEPRALVKKIKEYHPPLGDRSGLRLDFNENTFACSPKVLEALQRVTRGDLTMYPERTPVEAIVAAKLGIQPSQALLTNGMDEAIHVLCQAYLDKDDELLLPVPTYTMYGVYASATEGRLVEVPAAEGFRFPLEALLSRITPKTKLIAIANPNSPTGQTISREDILKVIAAAPHAMVLIDEAYYHFYGQSVMDLVGRIPNVIVARTFSKVYGLAGLRLGLLAADESAMQWLRRVISPYSVNALALACLPPALEDDAYIDWYVNEVKQAREEFTAALSSLGVPWWPSQANFVLTKIGPQHAAFSKAMHARGVLVRDRSSDPGCDGCVRITIGTREHTIAGIAAMAAVLNEIQWTGERA
ncbi:histidinol-phosphate transaminase [Silvibacterium sp.]|uniref:histidinol-phosphate transaminase n=1 Tax=Silvibacterium sp. TaxID=1964179 RepID=UPI0039E5585A